MKTTNQNLLTRIQDSFAVVSGLEFLKKENVICVEE